MARGSGSIEQTLARLRADPVDLDAVRAALVVKTANAGIVVAAAAKVVEAHGLNELTPALVAAFTALGAPKRDPGCRGRAAIVGALHALDHWAPEVFEAGLRIVQIEGGFDEGAQIRGGCAQAHAHLRRPNALDVCAEMLADPQVGARIGAARGLGESGHLDATAVLRFKLALGPDDGEVMAACFDGLFLLQRDRAIEVARRMLGTSDERSEAAALALGSNRATEATADLIAWCDRPGRSTTGYLALALLRSDDGNAALAAMIAKGSATRARAAAEALATFKHEPAIADLIATAATSVTDRALRAELLAMVPNR